MKGATTLSLFATAAAAADWKIDSREDIVDSSRQLARDLMSIYKGNESGNVPGLLPEDEYYFWQSGALMGQMVEYWHLTGDDSYNDVVREGLVHQVGPDEDFMPPNQTRSLGNDDQCHWALAAMTAAESDFQAAEDGPEWIDLAKAVFDTQVSRIDEEVCGGGLRWQIFNFNVGYNYKNTMSNACLMNLGARLARHTGNETYSDTVSELWDWMEEIGLMEDQPDFSVYSGTQVRGSKCSDVDKMEWSDSAALVVYTSAVMYNYTDGEEEWRERVQQATDVLDKFFPDDVAVERACEEDDLCDNDMVVFKGLAHRWLAATYEAAPFMKEQIMPVLETSAKAAVGQCTGGESGTRCGFFWSEGRYVKPEGSGAGEQMDVLAAVSSLLIGSDAEGTNGGSSSDDEDDSEGGGDQDEGDEGSPSGTGDAAEPSETSEGGGSGAGIMGVSVGTVLGMTILSLGL